VPVPGGDEKKAYFEPKEAQPDGHGVRVDGHPQQADGDDDIDKQQVAAPDIDGDEEMKLKKELMGEDKEDENSDRLAAPLGDQLGPGGVHQLARPDDQNQLKQGNVRDDLFRGPEDPQDDMEGREPEKQVIDGNDDDDADDGAAQDDDGDDDDGDGGDYLGDDADDKDKDLADQADEALNAGAQGQAANGDDEEEEDNDEDEDEDLVDDQDPNGLYQEEEDEDNEEDN